jgi:hypothetical protein
MDIYLVSKAICSVIFSFGKILQELHNTYIFSTLKYIVILTRFSL